MSVIGFDEQSGPRLELLNDCVHCGFCLSACPTYALWGEEADSPRGRIDLMRQGARDGEPLTESVVSHIDRCLGCMACVPACPSGVQYDKLIEAKRAEVEAVHHRPLRERALRGLVFRLFPYRRRLALAKVPLLAYQRLRLDRLMRSAPVQRRLPATLRALESIAPRIRRSPRLAERIPATGPRRAVVGMLTGCVQSAFFGDVNAATVRVLAAEGCEVVVPRSQGCCGALSAHAGR
ncbi:MAG TPA: 4Fe-4S dicluster domain-containing protein, partial [Micromonosporaceae bacterium]